MLRTTDQSNSIQIWTHSRNDNVSSLYKLSRSTGGFRTIMALN